MDKNESEIRERVIREKSTIPWKELQRFFASGTVIYVDQQLEIVDVAISLHEDNKDMVEEWMQSGGIAKVSDDQARQWFSMDAEVTAVVVRPWVLVQDISENKE